MKTGPDMTTLGAFAIIFDESSKVLLCHRTDRDMWNLPGGVVEPHEAPWQACVREVEEEVGLIVRVDRLLGIYSVPSKPDLVFNFLCVQTGGALRVTDEADQIGWFGRAEIPANTLPRHVLRIADAFAELRDVCCKIQH